MEPLSTDLGYETDFMIPIIGTHPLGLSFELKDGVFHID